MEEFTLPTPELKDLRGRQSVRATFKLSARAIAVLSAVAAHLGIKQKSLFDQLIEDTASLRAIAREIELVAFRSLERVQKTFVISRRTLVCLEEAARDASTPRDALVEYSIQRLLPVLFEEREKHRKRKALREEIHRQVGEAGKTLKKAVALLGEEDPLTLRLGEAVRGLCAFEAFLEELLEKGEAIERF